MLVNDQENRANTETIKKCLPHLEDQNGEEDVTFEVIIFIIKFI